jgi:putative transposase
LLVYEYKLDGAKIQYARMDEAVRVTQFIRNKSLRLWMDIPSTAANDLQAQCSRLRAAARWCARV